MTQFITPLILNTPVRRQDFLTARLFSGERFAPPPPPPVTFGLNNTNANPENPSPRIKYGQPDVTGPNLVLLANFPPPLPFLSVDTSSPLPRKQDYSIGTFDIAGVYSTPTPQLPFSLLDQPNPNSRNNDLWAHVTHNMPVFGFKPFNLVDQPNPAPRPIYTQQNQILGILPVGIPPPKPDMRVYYTGYMPRLPSYPDFNRFNALELGIPKPAPPYRQNDQPNPSPRPFSYPDFNRFNALELGIPKPAPPYRQNDQPNPSPRPFSYPDFNRFNALELGIPKPFKPTVQQALEGTPIQVRARMQPDLVPNLLIATLTPPISNYPFNNYDWPNPILKLDINNEGIFLFGSSIFTVGNQWPSITADNTNTWNNISDQTTIPWTEINTASTTPWTAVNVTDIPNIVGGES